ncbi:MAG: hypothetical protein HC919_14330 [Oscillatoriales cyanobacterium SM2_2_1]|nr:hypothetical protein [Oscillatoriales cyanobacterium SM2_2_1]
MKGSQSSRVRAFVGVLSGVTVLGAALPASAFVFTNNGGTIESGIDTFFEFNASGVTIENINLTIESLNVPDLSQLEIFLRAPDTAGVLQEDLTIQLISAGALNGTNLVNTIFDDSGTTRINDPANVAPYTGIFRPQADISGSATASSLDDLAVQRNFSALGTWRLRIVEQTATGTGTLGRVTLRVPFNMQSTTGMLLLTAIWAGHRLWQRKRAVLASVPQSVAG